MNSVMNINCIIQSRCSYTFSHVHVVCSESVVMVIVCVRAGTHTKNRGQLW